MGEQESLGDWTGRRKGPAGTDSKGWVGYVHRTLGSQGMSEREQRKWWDVRKPKETASFWPTKHFLFLNTLVPHFSKLLTLNRVDDCNHAINLSNVRDRGKGLCNTWNILFEKVVYLNCCCCVASVVSDSVRPHSQQPTGLCRPWDSPDKSTGVGCHFLLHI